MLSATDITNTGTSTSEGAYSTTIGWYPQQHPNEKPCPSCGYCPTCGRKNGQSPWNPYYPGWWQSPTVTYQGGTVIPGTIYNGLPPYDTASSFSAPNCGHATIN